MARRAVRRRRLAVNIPASESDLRSSPRNLLAGGAEAQASGMPTRRRPHRDRTAAGLWRLAILAVAALLRRDADGQRGWRAVANPLRPLLPRRDSRHRPTNSSPWPCCGAGGDSASCSRRRVSRARRADRPRRGLGRDVDRQAAGLGWSRSRARLRADRRRDASRRRSRRTSDQQFALYVESAPEKGAALRRARAACARASVRRRRSRRGSSDARWKRCAPRRDGRIRAMRRARTARLRRYTRFGSTAAAGPEVLRDFDALFVPWSTAGRRHR